MSHLSMNEHLKCAGESRLNGLERYTGLTSHGEKRTLTFPYNSGQLRLLSVTICQHRH